MDLNPGSIWKNAAGETHMLLSTDGYFEQDDGERGGGGLVIVRPYEQSRDEPNKLSWWRFTGGYTMMNAEHFRSKFTPVEFPAPARGARR